MELIEEALNDEDNEMLVLFDSFTLPLIPFQIFYNEALNQTKSWLESSMNLS
jgi:hypothetical protein